MDELRLMHGHNKKSLVSLAFPLEASKEPSNKQPCQAGTAREEGLLGLGDQL